MAVGPCKLWAASTEDGVVIVHCQSSEFPTFDIKNYPAFSPLTCQDIQTEFENVLADIRHSSGLNFPAPHLLILNDEYASGGAYAWKENLLEIQITKSTNAKKWRVVFAHEVGHVLYEYFVGQTHPEVHALENPADYRHVQDAYTELFADVVAALVFGDSEAVMIAVTTPTFMPEYLSFKSQPQAAQSLAVDAHSRFAPLRMDLWNEWIEPRKDDTAKLLTDLASIFIDDSATHYQEDIQLKFVARGAAEMGRLRGLLHLSPQ